MASAVFVPTPTDDVVDDHAVNDESPFTSIPQAPEDPMFGLSAAYRKDNSPRKVDLGVGAYRDSHLQPFVLPVVKKAKRIQFGDEELKHEYLPIAGLDTYVAAAQKLILGGDSTAIRENRIASLQTLSGTGALHLGACLLARFFPSGPAKRVHVSTPPYVNHIPILQHVSLQTSLYPYYSPSTQGIDFERMIDHLSSIPEGSIVLLHACAHNPTGVDPTRRQWKDIAQVMRRKHQVPFFDCAYQGFASGDLENDAWAIRHFMGLDFATILIAQSFAKNFGLYGERAGCLHVVTSTTELASRVQSQLTILQRVEISTPPAFGARIVSTILNDETLFHEWQEDLSNMANRILNMRSALRSHLERIKTPGDWKHITDQVGMFCFTGLTEAQVAQLRTNYHIYMTNNGRISIAGLNEDNVSYVAEAFKSVIVRPNL